MGNFVVKHTGLYLWVSWLAIAGLMKLGYHLINGYKPLTAFALLVAVSGLIAGVITTVKEEYGKRRMRQR